MTTLQFPHQYRPTTDRCVTRIGDHWYDLSAWRHAHPGGAQIVDDFHDRDATEAFFALHSKEAVAMLNKMKKVRQADTPRPTLSHAFEEFRKTLEKEGWFRRNYFVEAKQIVFFLVILSVGLLLRHSNPLMSIAFVGLGMQQAAWVSHDYAHMRGRSCRMLIQCCAIVNGMSRGWWTNKHNKHHVFPNRKEYDSDIHNEPVLHLWFPPPSKDVWFRRFQHIYYPIAYSFLLISWRMQCIEYVVTSRDWVERGILALSYTWLAMLPLHVSVGSILFAGFLMAIVVTANHQTEEILEKGEEYNFVLDQFRTTRGVKCGNWLTEYVFGGMQYQLEHHLFPTLPRYYYAALRPRVREFALANNMQYHMSEVAEILYLNYKVMKAIAQNQKDAGHVGS